MIIKIKMAIFCAISFVEANKYKNEKISDKFISIISFSF